MVFIAFVSIGNKITCNSVNRRKEPLSDFFFSLPHSHPKSLQHLDETHSKYSTAFPVNIVT